MPEQEQLDDFLEALEHCGSPVRNPVLREALGWEEEPYEAVKAGLVARRIVVRGRGRSDTVSLVGAEAVERSAAPSRLSDPSRRTLLMNPELLNELRKLRTEMAHGLAPT